MGIWASTLVLSLTTGAMITNIGVAGTFGFFAIITTIGAVYLNLKMENTEGKTYEECQQLFWPEKYRLGQSEVMKGELDENRGLIQQNTFVTVE